MARPLYPDDAIMRTYHLCPLTASLQDIPCERIQSLPTTRKACLGAHVALSGRFHEPSGVKNGRRLGLLGALSLRVVSEFDSFLPLDVRGACVQDLCLRPKKEHVSDQTNA